MGCRVSILQEVVGYLRRPSHFACTLQTKDEQIENQTVVLENKCRPQIRPSTCMRHICELG